MSRLDRSLPASRPPRRVWLVRAGRTAAAEDAALDKGLISFDVGVRGDFSDAIDRDELYVAIAQSNGSASERHINQLTSQLETLLHGVEVGDFAVMPLRSAGLVAIGIFRGDHGLDGDGKPGRRVQWIKRDVARSCFRQDLLFSFNAKQSIAEISRNDCASRIEAILKSGEDPGIGGWEDPLPSDCAVLEAMLVRRLQHRLGAVFAGHALAELVAELLKAEGYKVSVAPPGKDGGVDVRAGMGPLGMDMPLIVQVKSGDAIIGTEVLQQLEGAMSSTPGASGLLVAWGGLSQDARGLIKALHFRVRCWGAADVTEAYVTHYEKLPLRIRDKLPLRRVWTA